MSHYWLVANGGREPLVPGIIEDRYSLAGKEWRFFAASLLVVVLCTLGRMLLVTFSICMLVSVPDPLWYSGAYHLLV